MVASYGCVQTLGTKDINTAQVPGYMVETLYSGDRARILKKMCVHIRTKR